MGFNVTIEADGEVLQNFHPDGLKQGPLGRAVFNFLGALSSYCLQQRDNEFPADQSILDWFDSLGSGGDIQFCPACQALIESMWANGGDFTIYHEDEWEFYKKRHYIIESEFTEEMFLQMVREQREHYKPINEVLAGVQLLLGAFKQYSPPTEWFYEPQHTIPDFEALLANLELLAKRGNRRVRLTFT